MYDILIKDATIIRPEGRLVADIGIEDGRITYLGGNPGGRGHEEVSAIGRFVMPGVIDSHVHFRDPGHTYKEDWGSGSRAAVATGVTTVLDMPNTSPATLDVASARAKLSHASECSVSNFGVWVAGTADNIAQANEAWDAGLVCGIKVFMGDTTGGMVVPSEALGEIFGSGSGLIGVHAEEDKTLLEARARMRDQEAPCHNEVRPPSAALAAVTRLVELVRATNRPLHVCHLSTSDELELLAPLRGELPITSEVTPHHLYLSVETSSDQGNRIKVNPPIRSELDRRALWTAIRRNHIDTFGSDHAPHTAEEKALPYWDAPSGIPGVDTLYPLLMSSVKNTRMSLEAMVQMCCTAPARIFDLKGKGVIEVGADADLILFREGATSRLTEDDLRTKVGWSPFIGREIGVPPDLVVLNGRIAARSGVLADELALGQPVRYGRTAE
ncbi:MAG: dihydroorotase family protein [Myxococcota bacterium]|nr:dihydroorotase family protein [Myxococcota bacterium]